MASDTETYRIKREVEAGIFNADRDVYAVGLGPKFAGGRATGELAICVFVHVKVPNPPRPVPPLIQGVPTDVIQLAAPVEQRVFTGGDMITVQHAAGRSVGTLGCLARTAGVTDAQPPDVLLTCNHVLYPDIIGLSPSVVAPSCSDCCEPVIAVKGEPGGVHSAVRDKVLDAAIAKLVPGTDARAMVGKKAVTGTVDLHPPNWGVLPPEVLADFKKGAYTVEKVGQKTGLTRGIVRCVDTRMRPPDDGDIAHSGYHVVVKPVGKDKMFSDEGDSGSAVYDARTRIVALLWGGPNTRGVPDDDKYTFATPIKFIEGALRIRIATNPPVKVWRVPGETPLVRLHREVAATRAGRELLTAYGRHEDEVRERLRVDRRFVVAWHRGHGPAVAKSVVALVQEHRALPERLGDVSWRVGIEALAGSLRGLVSAGMVADLERWVPVAARLGGASYDTVLAEAGRP